MGCCHMLAIKKIKTNKRDYEMFANSNKWDVTVVFTAFACREMDQSLFQALNVENRREVMCIGDI